MTPATKQTKNDAGATSASASAIPEGEEAGPRTAEEEELQLRLLFDMNAKQAGAAPPQKHETRGEHNAREDVREDDEGGRGGCWGEVTTADLRDGARDDRLVVASSVMPICRDM